MSEHDEHTHKYVYQGAVTWPGDHMMPGSGARPRFYADAYYCESCLDVQLRNERAIGNTYEKVVSGAVEYTRRPA